MNKTYLSIIGFLLFITGVMSAVLSLVGLRFLFLRWLYNMGAIPTALFVISMIFGGVILIYIAKTSEDE